MRHHLMAQQLKKTNPFSVSYKSVNYVSNWFQRYNYTLAKNIPLCAQ